MGELANEFVDRNMRQMTGSGLPGYQRPGSQPRYRSQREDKRQANHQRQARSLRGAFGL